MESKFLFVVTVAMALTALTYGQSEIMKFMKIHGDENYWRWDPKKILNENDSRLQKNVLLKNVFNNNINLIVLSSSK